MNHLKRPSLIQPSPSNLKCSQLRLSFSLFHLNSWVLFSSDFSGLLAAADPAAAKQPPKL